MEWGGREAGEKRENLPFVGSFLQILAMVKTELG